MKFALKYMWTSQIIFKPLGLEKKWLRLQEKKKILFQIISLTITVISRYAPNLTQSMSVNSFQGPGIESQVSKEILAIIWTTWVQESVIWIYFSLIHFFPGLQCPQWIKINAGRLILYSFDSNSSRGDVSHGLCEI